MHKYCPNCGSENKLNSKFCPDCGKEYEPEIKKDDDRQPVNEMAATGLLFAFLFPLLGLIFSLVGLERSKTMNGDRRGEAIAGIIISIVFLVISFFLGMRMIIFGLDF